MRNVRLLVLVHLFLASPGPADDLARLVPEDTVVYLETTSLREAAGAVDRLPIWTDRTRRDRPGQEAIRVLFDRLAEAFGLSWGRSLAMARSVRRMEVALVRPDPVEVLVAVGLSKGSGPFLSILLGDALEKRTDAAGRTVYGLVSDDDLIVEGAFVGDRFLVAIGAGVLTATLDAAAGGHPRPLADRPAFRRTRADFGDAPLWAFVDPAGLGRWIDWGPGLDRALGLSDLEAIGLASSFEDEPGRTATRVRLHHPAGHPLPAILPDGGPIDGALPFLPAGSLLAATTSLRAADRSWARFRDLVVALEADLGGSDDFGRALAAWRGERRLDLDRTFADLEGPAALFVRQPVGPCSPDLLTFVVHPRPGAAPPDGHDDPRHEEHRGHRLRLGPTGRPAIATVDGFFLLGEAIGLRQAIDARSGQAAALGRAWRRFAGDHEVAFYLDLRSGLGPLLSAPVAGGRVDAGWPLLIGTAEREAAVDVELNVSLFTLGALVAASPDTFLDGSTWGRFWDAIRDLLAIPR